MGLSKHFVKPKIILIILIPIRTNLILREWEIKGSGRRESFDASQLGFCFSKTLVVFSTETQILVWNLAKKVIGNGAEGKMGSGKCGAKIFKTFVYEQSSRWAFSDPKKQHKKSKLSKLKKKCAKFYPPKFQEGNGFDHFFYLKRVEHRSAAFTKYSTRKEIMSKKSRAWLNIELSWKDFARYL